MGVGRSAQRGLGSKLGQRALLPFKELAIVDAMAVRPLLCLVYAPLLISALRRVLQPADGPGPPLESIILDKLASYNAPLHLFMWGDSTMQRQQRMCWPHSCKATPHFGQLSTSYFRWPCLRPSTLGQLAPSCANR